MFHKAIDVVFVAGVWFVRASKFTRANFFREALIRHPIVVLADVLKWIGEEPESINLLLAKVGNDGNAKKEDELVESEASSSLNSLIVENTLRR